MTDNSIESPRILSRRKFLGLAVANIAGWGLVGLGARMEEDRRTSNFGKYLKSEGLEYAVTDNPVILSISINLAKNEADQYVIRLRRAPHFTTTHQDLGPSEVDINYAVPVFGEAYGDSIWKNSGKSGRSSITINTRGEKFVGGYWLMISDKDGNPIDPKGQKINSESEKPFYTANDFTVLT